MEYRKLGKSGLSVSELCLGTMQFGWTADETTSLRVLDEAFEAGINFFDTADVYSRWVDGNPGGISERILGKWLAGRPGLRDQVVLATKVRGSMGEGPNDEGLSRKHIFNAVRASMTRMGTDYIDLYQLHWPDDQTPIEETLCALTDLVALGWVRYIGCSNFSAWQLVEALLLSELSGHSAFISIQPHYNLINREEYERDLQAVCQKYGLGVMPYSPLARGFLTGKYPFDGSPPSDDLRMSQRIEGYLQDTQKRDILATVVEIADQMGCSPSQISLAWLLSNQTVTSPIIGPRTIEQLEDNMGALLIELPQAEVERLNGVSAWIK